jgi:hypothetical protein
MASIIRGYEWDIFISYRQNDNHSGWVTEFVTALQEELAVTLKDSVSVFFDSSLPDGLLETHNVDRSLEDKLKCLIFIPIISQTYCDSKSFAWQYEFAGFIKLAREDQFGLDIRLANGNVASRILPVKIHDLETEDKTLLENTLEGVLRSIDFIYKSAGVNRPLSSREDHPQDNVNKTYYRDQINKVANAVKEIIAALKSGQDLLVGEKVSHDDPITLPGKEETRKKTWKSIKLRRKILVTGSSVSIILLAIFMVYQLINKEDIVNHSGEQILEKAINSCDFFHKWNNYHGKISLRTVRENGTHSDEIIEINTKEGYYQSVYTSGDLRYIKGIKNGRCFREINGDKNPDDSLVEKYSLDCSRIQYMKELNFCHFGLLMELKRSGLLLQKKVESVKFNGLNCLTLTFKCDTSKITSEYYDRLNFIVYLDPSDYSMKGVKWYGRLNAYIIFSGLLDVNGIKIPLCKTYFNSADNSLKFIDLVTLAN